MSSVRLLAILSFCLAALVPLQAGPTPPAGWTDGYVMANGIRLHYWRTGGAGKPALVLAHGSSDDALCWTNFARELTDRYDVVLYDARGHGLSDPPGAADTPDAQVEDLAGLIAALKLDKPVVMGHSMGSAAVAAFAAKYPDVPRAVVLEDPNLLRVPGAPLAPAATPPSPVDDRRAAILARNNRSEADLVADCLKNSPTWGRSECEFWAPSKRRHHPGTARVNNALRPAMRDLFPKITAPTLILKADAAADVRARNDAVAALLPKGKIVHVTGAGHNVRRENKAMTLEVLNAFLAAAPQVSSR
jgi:pimeloyl-ACP methyl ester carboxylesterase